MKKSFYHYKNYPSNYVRIHKGECGHCSFGEGVQNNILEDDNGEWSTGFDTYEEVLKDANKTVIFMPRSNARVHNCSICNPS